MASNVPRMGRAARVSLGGLWWLVLFFLYAPLTVVVIYSFNVAKYSAQFLGFSVRWYVMLLHNEAILGALRNSVVLGLGSAVVGTLLGTLLGYGLYKYRGRRIAWVSWIVYFPIIIPDIVFGISEAIFFVLVNDHTGLLPAGLLTMGLAHVSFEIPFVALVVYARLVGLDRSIFEAAQDLYASPLQRAYAFILPVCMPAVVSGFFLALTLSIDDFVISFFTAGPTSATLPIYIYGSIKKGVSPEINAIASLLIGAVLLVALGSVVADLLRGRKRFKPAAASA